MGKLLTVAEAASQLGVRRETVRRYILDGHLPALMLPGGYYRIRAEAVERCLGPIRRRQAAQAVTDQAALLAQGSTNG